MSHYLYRHLYRPILPRTILQELVDEEGNPDPVAISQYYDRFLQKPDTPDELMIAWVMAEILWSKYATDPIRLTSADAMCLKIAAVDFKVELPSLDHKQGGAYCYEFPVSPEIFFHGEQLTAILIADSGYGKDIGVVMQFLNGQTKGYIFSSDKIVEDANRAVTFPKSMNFDDVTTEQSIWLNYRQRMIFAYHLCNGLDSWREYRRQHFSTIDENDDPADWWKK